MSIDKVEPSALDLLLTRQTRQEAKASLFSKELDECDTITATVRSEF
jgi:hypothetical protein